MRVLAWNVAERAGGVKRLTPPGGSARGWIEVRERERPMVPVRELAAARAAEIEGAAIGPMERFVTAEGEHAATATIEGAHEAHTVGVVYLDEYMVVVDGRARVDAERGPVRETVRELVEHMPCGLGEARFRAYEYRAPDGWQGVARGLVTMWYAPAFPQVAAWIRVLPARPVRMAAGVMQVDTLLHDDTLTEFRVETKLIRGEPALEGFHCAITRVAGRFVSAQRDDSRRMLITAGLTDGRFVYGLRLDTGEADAAANEDAFLAMVRSCRPVPRVPSSTQGADVFSHWME